MSLQEITRVSLSAQSSPSMPVVVCLMCWGPRGDGWCKVTNEVLIVQHTLFPGNFKIDRRRKEILSLDKWELLMYPSNLRLKVIIHKIPLAGFRGTSGDVFCIAFILRILQEKVNGFPPTKKWPADIVLILQSTASNEAVHRSPHHCLPEHVAAEGGFAAPVGQPAEGVRMVKCIPSRQDYQLNNSYIKILCQYIKIMVMKISLLIFMFIKIDHAYFETVVKI